eukprot:scaffold6297_cov69-Cyclotella_meneghiniana.AAC.3
MSVVRQWTAAITALALPHSTFGWSVSVSTNLAVLTSKVMHMLKRFSAPKYAAAAVLMWRRQCGDAHSAARFREEIDRRWPWLKRQVGWPPGEE